MIRTAITTIDEQMGYDENIASYFNPVDVLLHLNERFSPDSNQPIILPLIKTQGLSTIDMYNWYEDKLQKAETETTVITTESKTQEYFEKLSEKGPSNELWLYNELLNYLNQAQQIQSDNDKSIDNKEMMLMIALYFNMKRNETEDVTQPDPEIAKLRRTALYLYKIIRIPGVTKKSGSFKTITMPYGIGEQADERLLQFENDIDFRNMKIARWNGQIPQKKEDNATDIIKEPKRSHKQYARVTSKKGYPLIPFGTLTNSIDIDHDKNPIPKKDIEREHLRDAYISKHIREILPPQFRENIVKYHEATANNHNGTAKSAWAEYIPNPLWNEQKYPEDINANPEKILKIAKLIEALNKENYYLTDLKFENFRQRTDGTPVLTDVGEIQYSQTGYKHLNSIIYARNASPKEVYSNMPAQIELQKIEVFQLAQLLLRSIFISQHSILLGSNLNQTIETSTTSHSTSDAFILDGQVVHELFDQDGISGRGLAYASIAYNRKNGKQDLDTTYYHENDFKQLILDSVNSDPEDRPTISEFTQRLNEIMEKRAQY